MPTANEIYASTKFARRVPADPRLAAALKSSSYRSDLMALRMGSFSAVKDAASTGSIFLQSELNKADTRLHMPLEGHTWFRDVPLTNGGGWVDTETAEFVEVYSPNQDGTGGESNDIGIVNFNRSQDVYPTAAWQRSIRIPLVDSLRLAQANKSPNDILDKAVRTDWNKTLDKRVYIGRNSTTYGLLNQPGVTSQLAANGAQGFPDWARKTPQEIVKDFNDIAKAAWNNSGNAINAIPDRFLVPASRWEYLLQPMVLNVPGSNVTAPYATVLEWIQGHYYGLSINGKRPEIVPLPSWAETVGAGGTPRLTGYVFSDEFLNFGILQDLQRMGGPLSLQDGAFVATYLGNTGVVKVLRTTTMRYVDGI